MVLLAAIILPHGAIPFDGDSNSGSAECRERHAKLEPTLRNSLKQLFDGTCEASKAIVSLDPELIILHTPHGIQLSDSYALYSNHNANGTAAWLGHWNEFEAKVNIDQGRTKELKEHLRNASVSVQGLTSFGLLETPLRAAEVVPIWFLKKYLTKDVKFIIVSEDSAQMGGGLEDWRLDIGKSMASFVAGIPERTLVVISGDTSHFHPTPCKDPLYLPHPDWQFPVNAETSPAFESAMVSWVNSSNMDYKDRSKVQKTKHSWNPDSSLPHLRDALALYPSSYACGMKGFVFLHGLLAAEIQRGAAFQSEIAVHEVPTYYGMMAATFVRL